MPSELPTFEEIAAFLSAEAEGKVPPQPDSGAIGGPVETPQRPPTLRPPKRPKGPMPTGRITVPREPVEIRENPYGAPPATSAAFRPPDMGRRRVLAGLIKALNDFKAQGKINEAFDIMAEISRTGSDLVEAGIGEGGYPYAKVRDQMRGLYTAQPQATPEQEREAAAKLQGRYDPLGYYANRAGNVITSQLIPKAVKGASELADVIQKAYIGGQMTGGVEGLSMEESLKAAREFELKPEERATTFTQPFVKRAEASISEAFPIDPTDKRFGTKLVDVAASSVPFIIGGLATGGSRIATALLGAVTNAEQIASEFDEKRGNKSRRDLSVAFAGIVGTLEAFGLGSIIARFGGKAGFFKRGFEIFEEGGQEALTEWLNNINAAAIGAYDPKRAQAAGLLEAAGFGSGLAGIFQAVDLLAGKKVKVRSTAGAARPEEALNTSFSVPLRTEDAALNVPQKIQRLENMAREWEGMVAQGREQTPEANLLIERMEALRDDVLTRVRKPEPVEQVEQPEPIMSITGKLPVRIPDVGRLSQKEEAKKKMLQEILRQYREPTGLEPWAWAEVDRRGGIAVVRDELYDLLDKEMPETKIPEFKPFEPADVLPRNERKENLDRFLAESVGKRPDGTPIVGYYPSTVGIEPIEMNPYMQSLYNPYGRGTYMHQDPEKAGGRAREPLGTFTIQDIYDFPGFQDMVDDLYLKMKARREKELLEELGPYRQNVTPEEREKIDWGSNGLYMLRREAQDKIIQMVSTVMRDNRSPNIRPFYFDIRKPFDFSKMYGAADIAAIREALIRDTGNRTGADEFMQIEEGEILDGVEEGIEGADIYKKLDMFLGGKVAEEKARIENPDRINGILQKAGFDGLTYIDGLGKMEDMVEIQTGQGEDADMEEARRHVYETGGILRSLPEYGVRNPLDADAAVASPEWWRLERELGAKLNIPFFGFPMGPTGGVTGADLYNAILTSIIQDPKFALQIASDPSLDATELADQFLREQGYDALTNFTPGKTETFVPGGSYIGPKVEGSRVFVAWDPEQIKSTTGNTGEFDEAEIGILASNPYKDPDVESVQQQVQAEIRAGWNKVLGRKLQVNNIELPLGETPVGFFNVKFVQPMGQEFPLTPAQEAVPPALFDRMFREAVKEYGPTATKLQNEFKEALAKSEQKFEEAKRVTPIQQKRAEGVEGIIHHPGADDTEAGTLFVTPESMVKLMAIFGVQRTAQTAPLGNTTQLHAMRKWIENLRNEGRTEDATAALAAAKEAAQKGFRSVAVINLPIGFSLDEASETIIHESFHMGQFLAAQARLRTAGNFTAVVSNPLDLVPLEMLDDNPGFKKMRESEFGRGLEMGVHSPQFLLIEFPTYLAEGRHRSFGLTLEEAGTALYDYFNGVVDHSGVEALATLATYGNLSPIVDDIAKGVLQKYGQPTGKQQLATIAKDAVFSGYLSEYAVVERTLPPEPERARVAGPPIQEVEGRREAREGDQGVDYGGAPQESRRFEGEPPEGPVGDPVTGWTDPVPLYERILNEKFDEAVFGALQDLMARGYADKVPYNQNEPMTFQIYDAVEAGIIPVREIERALQDNNLDMADFIAEMKRATSSRARALGRAGNAIQKFYRERGIARPELSREGRTVLTKAQLTLDELIAEAESIQKEMEEEQQRQREEERYRPEKPLMAVRTPGPGGPRRPPRIRSWVTRVNQAADRIERELKVLESQSPRSPEVVRRIAQARFNMVSAKHHAATDFARALNLLNDARDNLNAIARWTTNRATVSQEIKDVDGLLDQLEHSEMNRSMWEIYGSVLRGSMLNQLYGAARDGLTTLGRIPFEGISETMDAFVGAAWGAKTDPALNYRQRVAQRLEQNLKPMVDIALAWSPAERKKMGKLIVDLNKEFSFVEYKLLRTYQGDAAKGASVKGKVDELEQWIDKNKKIATTLTAKREKLRLLNRIAKAEKELADVKRIWDSAQQPVKRALLAWDRGLSYLNWPRWQQEFFLRRPYFTGWLETYVARDMGRDLYDMQLRGELGKIPEATVKKALDKALDFTLAYDPKKRAKREIGKPESDVSRAENLGYRWIQMMNALGPVGAFVGEAFPRFVYNAFRFHYHYGPWGAIAPVTRGFLNRSDKTGAARLSEPDIERIGEATAGTVLLFLANALVKWSGDEDEWWRLRIPMTGRTFDIRYWQPFGAYVWLASFYKRATEGRYYDLPVKDAAEQWLGLNSRNDAPSLLKEVFAYTVDAISGMEQDVDIQGDKIGGLKRMVARIPEVHLTFMKNFRDGATLFSDRANMKLDAASEIWYGPMLETIPIARNIEVPDEADPTKTRRLLPPRYEPLTAGPEQIGAPGWARLFGFQIDPQKSYAARELGRMGIDPSILIQRDPHPGVNRERNKFLGEHLQRISQRMEEADSGYQQMNDKQRAMYITDVITGEDGLLKDATEHALAQFPAEMARREEWSAAGNRFERRLTNAAERIKRLVERMPERRGGPRRGPSPTPTPPQ